MTLGRAFWVPIRNGVHPGESSGEQRLQTAAAAGAVAVETGNANAGNTGRSAVSSRSVPWPTARKSMLPQTGQTVSIERVSPQ